MAKDPGNRLKTALNIRVSGQAQPFTNQIGGKDPVDLFRFTVSQRSSLNLALTQLKDNANLSLLNGRGKTIAQSRQSGRKNESIVAPIDAGTYFIQVKPGGRQDQTRYRLTVFATPTSLLPDPNNPTINPTANTPPAISSNQRLTVQRGTQGIVSGSLLQTIDSEQTPQQLVYTVTAIPQAGQLLLRGAPLTPGSQFTQADIDSGQLSYVSSGIQSRLTNTAVNEIAEGLDGNNLIWNVSDNPAEILFAFFDRSEITRAFFYNGNTGIAAPLSTLNTTSEIVLGISGNNAVWNGIENNDDIEVFLYNSATGTSQQLTNNGIDEIAAGISGNNVIWNTFDGSPSTGAFFYNGNTRQTFQLTHPNSQSDQAIAISGDNVVWSGFDGNDLEVFFYHGATNRSFQLTNNSVDDMPEAISGTNIIWNSLVSRTDSDAFFFNGSTGETIQLTAPGSTNEAASFISENYIAWNAFINNSSEVMLYDIAANTSRQLTNSPSTDTVYGLSGSNLVWGSTTDNNTQLFFYNGSSGIATPLNSPATVALFGGLSGSNVALTLSDGTDSEIFLYSLGSIATADQFSFNVADPAGGITSGIFSITIT